MPHFARHAIFALGILTSAGCTENGGATDAGTMAQVVCGTNADLAPTPEAPPDAATTDQAVPALDASQPLDGAVAPSDGGLVPCSVNGNPGQCWDATQCAALPAHSAVAGSCSGPASVQCCVLTPNVANNPPVPTGWMLMQQANVTAEMTNWAVMILRSPGPYPIWTSVLRTFGTLTVMARVEWHAPDFQNPVVHRGVTLYQH
jgi:hypothetical protein